MNTPSLKHQVRAFYDEYHRQRMRVPDEYWLARVWSHFQGKVLDVGAGRLLWSSSSPDGYTVVDISVEAVRRAVCSGVCGVIGDGEAVPFGSGQFDLVACHDVLEHSVNPQQLIAEMCRVSRWRVLIASPNYVGDHYAPGFDRRLPLRVALFLLGPGRFHRRIQAPHLSFDATWGPDKDAITAANSWWMLQTIKRQGFRIVTIETWPRQFRQLNDLPVFRHLGPFALVVGERRRKV